MNKRIFFAATIVSILTGCSTTKTTDVQTSASEVQTEIPKPVEPQIEVKANPEFISIHEAIAALDNPETLDALAKKYGYKTISNYAVYRLDLYQKMLYKNCTPAKAIGKGIYEDTPKPLRKGTSSYIAVKEDITIGVFNENAYRNLTDQLLGTGFTLVSDGNEKEYSNGTFTAYCYASRKTVRLTK